MILELFADRLEAAGIGVQGQTIFINSMPDECHEGVLVRPTWEGLERNWEVPGMQTGGIALIARARSYPVADALARRAGDALTITSSETIGEVLVHYARPATTPVPYPETDGGYRECATRIDVCILV